MQFDLSGLAAAFSNKAISGPSSRTVKTAAPSRISPTKGGSVSRPSPVVVGRPASKPAPMPGRQQPSGVTPMSRDPRFPDLGPEVGIPGQPTPGPTPEQMEERKRRLSEMEQGTMFGGGRPQGPRVGIGRPGMRRKPIPRGMSFESPTQELAGMMASANRYPYRSFRLSGPMQMGM